MFWHRKNKENILTKGKLHKVTIVDKVRKNALIIAGYIFSTTITIAQVCSIDNHNNVIITVIILNIFTWIIVLMILIFTRSEKINNKAMTNLRVKIPPNKKVIEKYITNEYELRLMHKRDDEAYPDDNITWEQLLSWWTKNRNGIYFYQEGDKISGSIGLWPIKLDLYDKIRKGVIYEEKDMHIESFFNAEYEVKNQYWYMSGFFTKYLGADVINNYIANSFEQLCNRIDDDSSEIYITYFPVTNQEREVCEVLHFKEIIEETQNKLALFVYERNSLSDLREKIQQLRM